LLGQTLNRYRTILCNCLQYLLPSFHLRGDVVIYTMYVISIVLYFIILYIMQSDMTIRGLPMLRQAYRTDLTDAQWAILQPLLVLPDGGRPKTTESA
jgi:hypothetical protein